MNWDLLLSHSNLVYKLAQNAEWTKTELDERIGMAWLWAVDIYLNHFDPEKGKLSTILTLAIRNKFIKEWEKLDPKRQKTTNVEDSLIDLFRCERAIDPEKRSLLIDGLSRLSKDAKTVVWRLLHPTKGVVKKIRARKNDSLLVKFVSDDLGWTDYRFRKAMDEIKEVIYQ